MRHAYHLLAYAIRCTSCRQPAGRPCRSGNGTPLAGFHTPRSTRILELIRHWTDVEKTQLVELVADLRTATGDTYERLHAAVAALLEAPQRAPA